MMATSWRIWGWKLGLVNCLAMGGASTYKGDCALAQITPDGTLPNNSIVTVLLNLEKVNQVTLNGLRFDWAAPSVFRLTTGVVWPGDSS